METAATVRAFWAAMATNDFHAASLCLSPDFRLHWPQSGEWIIGRTNFAALNTAYPATGAWRFTITRLVAQGPDVITDVTVTDGNTHATAITFHTVSDGLITAQTEYWPDPFTAPPWRAKWVSRNQPRPT